MTITDTDEAKPVVVGREGDRGDEMTLEAFQLALLQLTGRRVPGLSEMEPQTDPIERN